MAVTEVSMRARIRVEGTVQGVGFRPFVYRLAGELGLGGWVLNDARGVLVEVEGAPRAVDGFVGRLGSEAPPLAVVERIRAEPVSSLGETSFTIRASPSGGEVSAPVTPDTATCEDCLRELFDPGNRRHRYPFINCTNCGPRFTIVRGVPYDRPLTTMAGFAMCEECRREYEDPTDRRFHAQPNACPVCGPGLVLVGAERRAAVGPERPAVDVAERRETASAGGDTLSVAAGELRAGAIVAVKGVGGFHLACLASDEAAVAGLRARKHREEKPFALMVGSMAEAMRLAVLGAEERELLISPRRPIVLVTRRPDVPVADSVAPGTPELGLMLPYSPLHHLLLAEVGEPLVMTSGNVSDEPIAYTDEDALGRLSTLADLFLLHDRPIETRTDDSVARVVCGRPLMIRRSRGYVPDSLRLPGGSPEPILACGAELKNTFCLVKGERAWVSHHIGDLENYATLRSFTAGIEHFERLFDVAPEVVAHDLHPEYLSTKYALEAEGVRPLGVQHHHAHLAACLAEHDEPGLAIGLIFDGAGWGADGTVWGGEVLAGDRREFDRVGMLMPVRLPGGDRAVREPWRMALAWLDAAGIESERPPPSLREIVAPSRWEAVRSIAHGGLASPLTSSAGRLFDAVAALAGLRGEVTYEGQAAIELERACDPAEHGRYPIDVRPSEAGTVLIDPREMIRRVVRDIASGVTPGQVASRFHSGFAAACVEAATRAAGERGLEVAALSGGVFQNRRLLESVGAGLGAAGLRVLIPRALPVGDGGISFGQAAVAAARL